MIDELSSKPQFGAMDTVGITDNNVMNRAFCFAESEIFHRLSEPVLKAFRTRRSSNKMNTGSCYPLQRL